MQWMLIATGGALGAISRFYFSEWLYAQLGRHFPFGTLGVNLLGSFIIGLAVVLLVERIAMPPEWRLLVITGFLGSLTTFSTFALESSELLTNSSWLKLLANISANVAGCIAAVLVGLYIGRTLFSH